MRKINKSGLHFVTGITDGDGDSLIELNAKKPSIKLINKDGNYIYVCANKMVTHYDGITYTHNFFPSKTGEKK